MKNEELMSVKQVAHRLEYSQAHVRRLIRQGSIKGEKIGTEYIIKEKDIKGYHRATKR